MIRAIYFPDTATLKDRLTPGSFSLEPRPDARRFEFVYVCPCGCGLMGRLLIGEGHKPSGPRPSRAWNGSKTEPTLSPSVNHVGHWHGWLRDGYWEAC